MLQPRRAQTLSDSRERGALPHPYPYLYLTLPNTSNTLLLSGLSSSPAPSPPPSPSASPTSSRSSSPENLRRSPDTAFKITLKHSICHDEETTIYRTSRTYAPNATVYSSETSESFNALNTKVERLEVRATR